MTNLNKVIDSLEQIERFRRHSDGKNSFDFTGVIFSCEIDFQSILNGEPFESVIFKEAVFKEDVFFHKS